MIGARYINVFRDNTGEIHYSNEEFPLFQQELCGLESAVSDAYRHAVIGTWHYMATLTNDAAISEAVRKRLNHLEQTKAIVEMHGRTAADYTAAEIETEAFSL